MQNVMILRSALFFFVGSFIISSLSNLESIELLVSHGIVTRAIPVLLAFLAGAIVCLIMLNNRR